MPADEKAHLVEEEEGRVGHHLRRNREALQLLAAQACPGGPDHAVADALEFEQLQDVPHKGVARLGGHLR